jgi:hypothetical protein
MKKTTQKKKDGAKLPLVVVMKKMDTKERGKQSFPFDGYYGNNNQKKRGGTKLPSVAGMNKKTNMRERRSKPLPNNYFEEDKHERRRK